MPATTSDLALSTTTLAIIQNGSAKQNGQTANFKSSLNDEPERSEPFIVKYRHNYYDITHFLKKHPGGINTLHGLQNGDMTARFMYAPPHSDAAMYLLQEYEIKPAQLQNGRQPKQDQHLLPQAFESTTERSIELIAEAEQDETNTIQLDERMEHLVDWSSAMLPQIAHIAHHYDDWVHKPVDRPLRLFGPTYLEVFTKTPWWVIPLFWIPVISKFLWDEFAESWTKASRAKLSLLVAYFAVGILLWTVIEYVLHRFVFHIKMDAHTNPWLCTFHFMIHGLHHKVPFDSKRLVFPPLPGAIIAAIIYAPLSFILPYPRIMLAGALFGYLCYDLMHYYLHHGNPSLHRTRFMYDMKRYHYQHHFAHQNMAYGISSPLWDIVFNTRIHLRQLRFPLRWR